MVTIPKRGLNLALQLAAISNAVPSARGRVRRGQLDCTLRLQPSPASRTYTIRLIYRQNRRPRVTVTDPGLEPRVGADSLPHVYPGDELCLCYPGQWRHDMLIAHTIVPWTAEWLMHYELWLVTGRWDGGGHTHTTDDVLTYTPSPEA